MLDGELVVRLRAGTTVDPYSSEPALDWSAPSELTMRALVGGGGSVEPVEVARSAVSSDLDVFFESGADLRASDRVRVRGLVYEVMGDPFDWRPMLVPPWGLVAKLRRVEG